MLSNFNPRIHLLPKGGEFNDWAIKEFERVVGRERVFFSLDSAFEEFMKDPRNEFKCVVLKFGPKAFSDFE